MVNQRPWIERKGVQIVDVLIALGGLGNLSLLYYLFTLPDFSFNNLWGGIFVLTLINTVAIVRLLPILVNQD